MMRWWARWLAWSAVAGGLVLPLLSINGYDPAGLEYLLVAGGALAVAAVIASFARWRMVTGAMVLVAGVLFAAQYAASPILWREQPWIPFAVSFGIGAFSYAATLRPREMLVILASGAAMHVVSSAALSPPMLTTATRAPASVSPDRGPVLHVLLDEHAGLAAIPPQALPPERREAFLKPYLDRGFIVFSHAFTADTYTSDSVARLFNPSIADPKSVVKDQRAPSGWAIQRAELLERIGRHREVKIFGSAVINLAPAAANVPNATLVRNLLPTHVGPGELRAALGWGERAKYAVARGMTWLRADFESPLAAVATRYLPLGYENVGLDTRLLFADSSLRALAQTSHGAWYGFLHVLLPHTPFMYDGNCALLPPREWSSRYPSFTPPWRVERYSAHVRQAECIAGRLLAGLDAMDARSDWPRAAAIVHGDHGSRLAIEDRAVWPRIENAKSELGRDIYATFLAVRLQGASRGMVIDTPVRIDDVFAHLVGTDFRTLDPSSLPRRPNPF